MQDILKKLNPAQRQAVTHPGGPLLVLAGAGSGKTRVLACRIAFLLSQGVRPDSILAVTFTNKAAEEMRQRVQHMVGDAASRVVLATFHSFCARFLRREIEKLPGGRFTSHFTIYDADDTLSLIKTVVKELNLDDKRFRPGALQAAISRAKSLFQDEKDFAAQAQDFFSQKTAEVYKLYAEKLRQSNALDFDDLLLYTVRLLTEAPDVLAYYRQRFLHILVDEYQDTNRAQYEIIRLLAEEHQNVFVVGDPDQSIYTWRGADIRNILDFERDFPAAGTVKLEENYRSTRTILEAANAVIANNFSRLDKVLRTDNRAGEPVTLFVADDERCEAKFVADTIARMNAVYRTPFRDFAVFYRTNAQSRLIEEMLLQYGIPYTIVGGLKFYERKEIKDIIAYLRLIANPADNLSLLRIINVPRRGVGEATISRLTSYAAEYHIPIFDAVSNPVLVPGLGPKAIRQLESLACLVFELAGLVDRVPLPELIWQVIRKTGYLEELESDQAPQAQERIANLHELAGVAREFAARSENGLEGGLLEEFLARIALMSDNDAAAATPDDEVTLMTLHAAKGLEFPTVFLVGMEEGIFPHFRSLYGNGEDSQELEEERRLCYVGITRAMRKLFLTYARQRTLYGTTAPSRPSRFLAELPHELLERHDGTAVASRPLSSAAEVPGRAAAGSAPFTVIKGGAEASPGRNASAAAGQGWRVGEKARHAKWGVGTVVDVRGSGEDQEVRIAFPNAGIKALMVRYAPLDKV